MSRKRRADSEMGGGASSIYAAHMKARSIGDSIAVDRFRVIENMYRRVLTNLATNRFEWVGMPNTVDTRFLELTLHFHGLAVFYYEPSMSRYLALRAAAAGNVNMYDNPTAFTVYGNTMINRTLSRGSKEKFVPIWSNYMRMPEQDIVNVYANRLATLDTTIDVNAQQMRVPVVLAAPPQMRLSIQNMYKQWIEGQPAILATDGGLDALRDSLGAFPFSPNEKILGEVQVAKTRIWNECMTILGLNNANQDKKERLVSDEVAANNDQVQALRNANMTPRQEAAEMINDLYGLSVRCEWRQAGSALLGLEPAMVEAGLQGSAGEGEVSFNG